MTDYRALCAELLEWAEQTSAHYVVHPDVILRARAALAEQPVEPTDEELWAVGNDDFRANCYPTDAIHYARAVLARWGQPAATPIPVAERLPGPKDLDREGTCWMFHPINLHYCLCVPDPSAHTHWLPANALPTPEELK
jgi:hypothetical protein